MRRAVSGTSYAIPSSKIPLADQSRAFPGIFGHFLGILPLPEAFEFLKELLAECLLSSPLGSRGSACQSVMRKKGASRMFFFLEKLVFP